MTFPPAEGKNTPPAKSPNKNTNAGEDSSTVPGGGPSQRKNQQRLPPPPPTLTIMYKLQYGGTLEYVHPDGTVQQFEQWKSFPRDGHGLVSKANEALEGVNYQYATKPLASDGFDPVDIPLLYMTGDYAFEFTDTEVDHLRRFLLDGGTILFNAARGRDAFNRAVVEQMRRVFPNKSFMKLPMDHPIFNARRRIRRISVTADGSRFMQPLEAYSIDIGTRAAAILLPWGAGAAWSDADEYHPRGKHIIGEAADRLGVNIIAYTLGSTRYGRFLSQEFPVYHGRVPTQGDAVRFAIARYNGSYDLHPSLQNSVLTMLRERLELPVDYAPAYVDLGTGAIGQYPLVFMTGHYDFELTDAQVTNLRQYFKRGGVLFASAAAGLSPFDTAFRREMKRVIDGQAFVKLPPTHSMFVDGPIRIDSVKYTPPALSDDPTLDQPEFFGMYVEDRLAVVYT
ncbi:MAG: DUF4159 domain-containing protein, partial [bacterium]